MSVPVELQQTVTIRNKLRLARAAGGGIRKTRQSVSGRDLGA